MTPEELAMKVLNESEITDFSNSNSMNFSPFLEIALNKDTFGSGNPAVYGSVGSCTLLLRNISLFFTVRHDNFSIDEWRSIPKKLKKGLSSLHDKGELIPLLNAHTLL